MGDDPMKKVLTVLLTVALVTAFSMPAFAASGSAGASTASKVKVTKMTMKYSAKGLKVSIKYPKVSGMKNKTAQKKINVSLYRSAKKALNEGKSNLAKLKKEKIKNISCTTIFRYKVTYNKNKLLSVVMQDYQSDGAAHGITLQSSKTFSITTGDQLKFKSLFSDSAAATSRINASVRKQIDERHLFELVKFNSIGSNPGYYLYNNGVTVYFQEYQYFPYSEGIQEFKTTFNALQPYMAGKYALLNPYLTALSTKSANNLKAGYYGYIKAAANATTGYSWTAVSDNTAAAAVVKQYYITKPNPKHLDGVGGTEIIIVKGKAAGTASIRCKYARSFDPSNSITRVYKVTVQ